MTALDRALKYLNIKPRTRHQVEQYLKGKEYAEDEIVEALAQLEEYHYIDDLNFARMYIELGFEKGRGMARIRRELSEKGVNRDTIAAAIDELEELPDEYKMALKIGRNIVGGIDVSALEYKDIQKLRAKIARRLAGRGYTRDVAYKVAKECTDK